MVACITPSDKEVCNTLSTLKYASLTERVINTPVINIEPRLRLISELKQQVKELQREVSLLRTRVPLSPEVRERNPELNALAQQNQALQLQVHSRGDECQQSEKS